MNILITISWLIVVLFIYYVRYALPLICRLVPISGDLVDKILLV